MKPKILIIAGPTASGKKKLACEAALRFDGEIVSADSRKVYRFLDIGTAKPSIEEREHIPHHLINIVDPDKPFSAGEWVKRASFAVRDILARGKLPVLSGGTGFYISAFCDGLSEVTVPEPEERSRLEDELLREGSASMYRKLASVDPERATQLHEHDTYRVLRSLEIYYSTGQTFSGLREKKKVTGGDYSYCTLGITMPRKKLYRQIDERVDVMISQGLLNELKDVLEMGYSRELPSLDTVGYKEWFPYLDGRESFDKCLENVKRDTQHYAKRQMTWFRARSDITWFDAGEPGFTGETIQHIKAFLESG